MWKDIIGFEGIYKINEYGDVMKISSGKILSPYINNHGYKMIDLHKNGKRCRWLIHRLVAIHYVRNPNNCPIVLHKDNNKLNTYYQNLEWGTYSENNSQAIRDGLNTIPRPDNRVYYELYSDSVSFIIHGLENVRHLTNDIYTDSNMRNLIY